MNKTLKWVLIGLAIAVVVFFIALSIFYMARVARGSSELGWWGGMTPFQGMRPSRSDYHMPFLGAMPMMGFFGLSRLLLPLVVVGFAVYGIVRLVGGGSNRYGTGSTQAPPPVPSAPVVERTCVSCGQALHSEGEFCPHCGAKQ